MRACFLAAASTEGMCQSKAEGGKRCETALARPGYAEMRRAYAAAPNPERIRQSFRDRVVRFAATGAGARQVAEDAEALAASDPQQSAWLSACLREGAVRARAKDAAGQQQCGESASDVEAPRWDGEAMFRGFLSSEYAYDLGDLASLEPQQLHGLCESVNGDFGMWLEDDGADDVLLVDYVSRADGDLPADQPHTVVVADGHVYDLTYRQFVEDAPTLLRVPVEQWEKSWDRLGEVGIAEVRKDYDDEDYLRPGFDPGLQCVECGQQLTARRVTGLCWNCFQAEFSHEAKLLGMSGSQAEMWVMEQFTADEMDAHEIPDAAYAGYERAYAASGSGTKYGYDEDYGTLPGVSWDSYRSRDWSLGARWAGGGYGSGGRLPTVPYVNPHAKAIEQVKSTGKVVRRSLGRADSGDGYVYLPQPDGEVLRVWGLYGASGVLIRNRDDDGVERFFLAQRGGHVDGGGGTWAVPGGALDAGETPTQGALREFREEIKATDVELDIHTEHLDQVHEEWSYTTVIADARQRFDAPAKLDWETKAVGWFTREEISAMPLHPGFAKTWPELLARLDERADAH